MFRISERSVFSHGAKRHGPAYACKATAWLVECVERWTPGWVPLAGRLSLLEGVEAPPVHVWTGGGQGEPLFREAA